VDEIIAHDAHPYSPVATAPRSGPLRRRSGAESIINIHMLATKWKC